MDIFKRIGRNRKLDKLLKKEWDEIVDEGGGVLDEIDRKIESGALSPAPYEIPQDFAERVLAGETQTSTGGEIIPEPASWAPVKLLPFAAAKTPDQEGVEGGRLPFKFDYENFSGEIYLDLRKNICVFFELKKKELSAKYNGKTIFIRIEGEIGEFGETIENGSARVILGGIDLANFDPKTLQVSLTIPEGE